MDLIPGLPDDTGLDCLVRIPHQYFPSVAAVCRSWNREIRLKEFWRRRRASGSIRKVVVMVQARVDPARDTGSEKHVPGSGPGYRLTVFEPGSGYWAELPPMPGWEDGLPMFCGVAAVQRSVVVVGGWRAATGEVFKGVYVYDFLSAQWRRGADMPGGPRSLFACASDFDRAVYVAGGHDGDKCALSSALAYDVAEDNWSTIPNMAVARDEAKGAYHAGKFHVIGGYETGQQGRFVVSAEAFDAATGQWGALDDDFLDVAMCPRNIAESQDGGLFMCRGGDVACRQGSTWRAVAELPAEVRNRVTWMTAWQGMVLVIGSAPCKSYYKLNLKGQTWETLESEDGFSGHVQLGCCLEL